MKALNLIFKLRSLFVTNYRLFLLLLASAAAPIVFSSLGIIWIYNNEWFFQLPLFLGLTIFTVSSIFLVGLALVPSTIIAILAGYYYQWWGIFSVLVYYPIAALVGLGFSILLIKLVGAKRFSDIPEYREFEKLLSKDHLLLVIYLRISPTFPFAMINVFLATLSIRLSKYIIGSVIGMLPRTAIFFWLGMNAPEIGEMISNPSLDGVLNLIPLVLVFLSLAGLFVIARRALAEQVKESASSRTQLPL